MQLYLAWIAELSWMSPHKIPRHLFRYDQSRNHYLWDATTESPLSLYLACTHAAVDRGIPNDGGRCPIWLVFYTVYLWSSLPPNTTCFKHQTLLHHLTIYSPFTPASALDVQGAFLSCDCDNSDTCVAFQSQRPQIARLSIQFISDHLNKDGEAPLQFLPPNITRFKHQTRIRTAPSAFFLDLWPYHAVLTLNVYRHMTSTLRPSRFP